MILVIAIVAGIPTVLALACIAAVPGLDVRSCAFTGLTGPLLASLIAIVLGNRWVHRPLARLAKAARELGQGALHTRIGGPYPDGEVGQLMAVFDSVAGQCELNLSGLRNANEQLEAANRALGLLKASHKILLYATSEAQMCASLCRAVVELGGYRHSCIAIADERAVGSTTPESFTRSVCFPDAGRSCPCSIAAGVARDASAAQTGNVVGMDDAGCELRCSPRRKFAAGSACESGVVIPLAVAGSPSFGALTVCSAHGGPLTQADRDVLAELAGDLAFGLQVLRLRERDQRRESELERRVSERTAELEGLNADLESFSYSVSHDLRAPLRAIDGFSYLIATDYADRLDAHGARMLASIRHSAQRMGNVIDAMMDFSRTGSRVLRRERVNMRDLVTGVVGELGESQSLDHIEMEIGALPDAAGDGELFRRIWYNLLSNAVKFSARQPHPRIEVSGYGGEQFATYQVRDNGAGFDMKHHDRLFKAFERLHGDADFPGTGIGLAIAQRVVERHGGRMWAEASPGGGALFGFSLPATGAERQPPRQPAKASQCLSA